MGKLIKFLVIAILAIAITGFSITALAVFVMLWLITLIFRFVAWAIQILP